MKISRNALAHALNVAVRQQRRLRKKGTPMTRLHEELESVEFELDAFPDSVHTQSLDIVKKNDCLFVFNPQSQSKKETHVNKPKLMSFTAYFTYLIDAQQELRRMKEKFDLLKKGGQSFETPAETYGENREAGQALTVYMEMCTLVSAQKELYIKQAGSNFQRVYKATKDLYKQLLGMKTKGDMVKRASKISGECVTRIYASRTALNFLRHDLETANRKKEEDSVVNASSSETPTVWPVKLEGVKVKTAAKVLKKGKKAKRSVDAGPAVEAKGKKGE